MKKRVISLFLLVLLVTTLLSGCSEKTETAISLAVDVLDAVLSEQADEADSVQAPADTAQPDTLKKNNKKTDNKKKIEVTEDGTYCDKEHVALYISKFGHLPDNFMKKRDAEDEYGWTGGALSKLAPGRSIGGDRFGNYEKILPVQKGRTYYECDIDTEGRSSRGAKRIIFSNDGLVYYTEDHYETFELLYGEP